MGKSIWIDSPGRIDSAWRIVMKNFNSVPQLQHFSYLHHCAARCVMADIRALLQRQLAALLQCGPAGHGFVAPLVWTVEEEGSEFWVWPWRRRVLLGPSLTFGTWDSLRASDYRREHCSASQPHAVMTVSSYLSSPCVMPRWRCAFCVAQKRLPTVSAVARKFLGVTATFCGIWVFPKTGYVVSDLRALLKPNSSSHFWTVIEICSLWIELCSCIAVWWYIDVLIDWLINQF